VTLGSPQLVTTFYTYPEPTPIRSFKLSEQTEQAQQENISIKCERVGDKIKFLRIEGKDAPYAIETVWLSRITNNSRAPVNID